MCIFQLVWAVFGGATALAGGHHHPKHNMILYGEYEIFVSHVVYKVPHNFQIILKIKLDQKTRELYLKERTTHSQDQFIFLLDEMEIKNIAEAPSISGALIRSDADGKRHEILPHVGLERKDFEIVYFSELPLSLE